MNQIEQNIVNSFRLAKSDIIRLNNTAIELKNNEEILLERITRLEEQVKALKISGQNTIIKQFSAPRSVTKTITVGKPIKKIYVASKDSNKFHISNCPFAQNIKPKKKIVFKTRTRALNNGYKPCKCIKR